MTVRLLVAYGDYPINAIVSLDPGTEAGLIASGQASATLTGGNPYSPPPVQKQKWPVIAETSPGGGNRLLAGNLPADMAQLSNVVVSDGVLHSWTANGIDYVATYAGGKVATITTSDGWVQTYTWAGDVPTITVAKE